MYEFEFISGFSVLFPLLVFYFASAPVFQLFSLYILISIGTPFNSFSKISYFFYFLFYMNFKISLSSLPPHKNSYWYSYWYCIQFLDYWRKLTSSFPEHSIPFNLLIPSVSLFILMFNCLKYRCWVFLVKFIHSSNLCKCYRMGSFLSFDFFYPATFWILSLSVIVLQLILLGYHL